MPDPKNPEFEQVVRDSFARQPFMDTLGASLESVTPGEVVLRLPFRTDLTQQHGFLHAGAVAAVLDSACGYAALSLMPAGVGVLSIEFKTNLLAPAQGDEVLIRARVVRAGRNITVSQADAYARRGDAETLAATMLATIMTIGDRPDVIA